MLKWHANNQKINKTIDLFEQLLVLIDLNLPLHQCLQRIGHASPEFEPLLVEVNLGQDLPIALDKLLPKLDSWGICLLKIACDIENPKPCLKMYLQHQIIKRTIQHKIQQASFYPFILMAMACLILLLFNTQIMPSYQKLFQQLAIPSVKNSHQDLFLYLSLIIFGLQSRLSQLFFFTNLRHRMQWLEWFNLMSIAMSSGLNFPNSLKLTLPQLNKSHLLSWHQQLIQDLHLGQLELVFPATLPKSCQAMTNLYAYSFDWKTLFIHASKTIELEINKTIANIERYLQPLLLFIITGFCAYLCMLIYRPLLQLGEQIF